MKIIFLDLDGVLIPSLEGISVSFDETCIKSLETLIVYTDADIVISSNWRTRHKLSEISNILRREKFKFWYKIIDTIDVTINKCEGIIKWLEEHKVSSFVVYDDDDIGFYDNFIRTDEYVGLTKENVNQGVELLNNT